MESWVAYRPSTSTELSVSTLGSGLSLAREMVSFSTWMPAPTSSMVYSTLMCIYSDRASIWRLRSSRSSRALSP